MKKILLLLIILSNTIIFAQVNPKKCITTKLVKVELEHNQEYDLIRQKLVNYQKKNKDIISKNADVITIPVVVHIVHRTLDNLGDNTNIPNIQIADQLRILNEDYSKTNPEFPNPPRNTFFNNSGNPQLQFCLATIDPEGNPTTGITRTSSSQLSWNADDNNEANFMKLTSQGGIDSWNPLEYLNIWVCNLSNSGGGETLGYAFPPGLQALPNQSWKDGIVVDYQYFGTNGNSSNSSDGRTLTHEAGHYFGLMHTFCEENGCCDNDASSQYSWGEVDDTPASYYINANGFNGPYFQNVNSNTTNNTCNDLSYSNIFNTDVLDMDENYMSYAKDTWMFSEGQVEVMRANLNATLWQGGRKDLWENSTVTVNCSGTVDINSNKTKNLYLYPNPTNGRIFISSTIDYGDISIYNIFGKKVLSNVKSEKNFLDISHLNDGIYLIRISMENYTFNNKIILSR